MFEILIYLLILILVLFVFFAIGYSRRHYGVLEGISGLNSIVRPYFVGGSNPGFYRNICCFDDYNRVKTYGKVYGFYHGRDPQIYVADPELIRLIFVKDFEHFCDRAFADLGHPVLKEVMEFLEYDRWKLVRSHLSPQLTTGKRRVLGKTMEVVSTEWVSKLTAEIKENEVKIFEPKRFFTLLASDVTFRCIFGTKISAYDDPNSEFVKSILTITGEDLKPHIGFSIAASLPFLQSQLHAHIADRDIVEYFVKLILQILDDRRGTEVRMDFVDAINNMRDKCNTDPEFKKLRMTELTILSQAVFLLGAGFEATSSALRSTSFYLAKHPEVQKRVLKEIDDYRDRHGGKIQYDTLRELVLLEACLNESMRLSATSVRLERLCMKNWTHEPSGLTIKKGVGIMVPVYAVHHDPINFTNPEKFDPDRFLPCNRDQMNPYAFLAFGHGPHNCIGKMFGMDNMLTTMAILLRKFEIEDTHSAVLEPKPGRIFLNNFTEINLGLRLRN